MKDPMLSLYLGPYFLIIIQNRFCQTKSLATCGGGIEAGGEARPRGEVVGWKYWSNLFKKSIKLNLPFHVINIYRRYKWQKEKFFLTCIKCYQERKRVFSLFNSALFDQFTWSDKIQAQKNLSKDDA